MILFRFIPVIILILLFCSDKNLVVNSKVLSGTWNETYIQNIVKLTGRVDSVHSTSITFDGNSFSVSKYDDSIPNDYDTTYTGTYAANSDTIYFYPENFSEVFKLTMLSNGNMLLDKMYSLDANGVKMGDFESILWCTIVKRKGIFIPN